MVHERHKNGHRYYHMSIGIGKFEISTFFGNSKMTFRKVTPTTTIVNEKNSDKFPWDLDIW